MIGRLAASLTAFVLLTSAGCSDDSTADRTDPGEAGALVAASDYVQAVLSGDSPRSYELLSTACRAKYTLQMHETQVAAWDAIRSEFYDLDSEQVDSLEATNFHATSITDEEAVISATLTSADTLVEDSTEGPGGRYVYDDGSWWATCDYHFVADNP